MTIPQDAYKIGYALCLAQHLDSLKVMILGEADGESPWPFNGTSNIAECKPIFFLFCGQST